MCIGYTPPHWSLPFVLAVPFALLLAGVALLVSVRFVDRRRAWWIAVSVGVAGYIVGSFVLMMVTGAYFQRC